MSQTMPNHEEANELRCIRVDGMPPLTDAVYLYSCFHDNTKVVAATVLRDRPKQVSLDYGFVEFASHEDAEFALEFYNGERMPNFNYERFCLSWDTDHLATMWRWDHFYRLCSFFGYDYTGDILDANTVIKVSPPCERPNLPCMSTQLIPKYQQLQKQSFGGHAAAYVNQLPYQQLQTQSMGGHAAAYVNQPPYQQLQNQSVYGPGAEYVNLISYQQLQTLVVGGYGVAYVDQPLYQQCQARCNVGSDARTLGQLTQVRKIGPLMKREKELYLCFEEFSYEISFYVIRTIKLSELLLCSCGFDTDTRTITKCNYCAPKNRQESLLHQRAWIFSGPAYVCKEQIIPKAMGCLAYGSRMLFAGGVVPPQDTAPLEGFVPPPEGFVPCGYVYSFEPESTVWEKLDWSFLEAKPFPLLFEVNRNLYCLSVDTFESSVVHPSFEVYDSSSRKCSFLPEPHVDLPGLKYGRSLISYLADHSMSCAVVGTKILISFKEGLLKSPCIPVLCIDVDDKEPKWRVMDSLFDGKPFPFKGRALVLDSNGTHVMFSFRDECQIYVSRLAVNVTGDISISHEKRMWIHVYDMMRKLYPRSHTFVDLGDQNVAFVLCGTVTSQKPCGLFMGKVRGVVIVMHYELSGSEDVTCEYLATRTFEYDCRSPKVFHTDLICGLMA